MVDVEPEPGTANCPVVVNNDALDALPTSSRIALLSSVDEALDHFIDNYKAVTLTAWDATLSERQIMQLTLNDDILNAISNEVAGPSAGLGSRKKKHWGFPAQELYDLVNKTLADMR